MNELDALKNRSIPENRLYIVKKYRHFVKEIAERHRLNKHSIDDLIQQGYIGLLLAFDTYKQGTAKFSTYAYVCIRNEMLKYINKESNVYCSAFLAEYTIKVNKIIATLQPEDWQNADLICEKIKQRYKTNVSIDTIHYVLTYMDQEVRSLLNGDAYDLIDMDSVNSKLDAKEKIQSIDMSNVSSRQREVIDLVIYKGMTKIEASKAMHISYGRTLVLYNKAIDNLTKLAQTRGINDRVKRPVYSP